MACAHATCAQACENEVSCGQEDAHVIVLCHLVWVVLEHALPVRLFDVRLRCTKSQILETQHLVIVFLVAHRRQCCTQSILSTLHVIKQALHRNASWYAQECSKITGFLLPPAKSVALPPGDRASSASVFFLSAAISSLFNSI